ncbi:TPA: restriction endonuclease subunit S [Streptococcus suis]
MPNKDKNIPKRRFKAFENADAWELRKLGEVARFRRGSFPQPYGNSEWYDGDGAMPFVQVADVTDEMNLVGDTKQKISKKAQPLSVYAEKGSVLVTLQGSIGRVAITQYGAFIDRTVLIFENFYLPIDNLFWAYVIKQKFIEEAKSAPGGTIKTITKEVLSDFNIKLPTYSEQSAIGTFFSTLDSQITLHQRKLEKLKNLKKALLNELFV